MRKLDRMGENGLKYPEYQLLEAYLLHLEGEDDQASEILERYQNKSFHHNELELAGIYLYLCTQTGLYRDKEQALRKVQNFQMQKEDSFILLKLVFEMDHTLSPSKKIFLMEELLSGDVQVLFCIWKHGTVFVQICLCCIESMGSGPRYSFLQEKNRC